MLHDTQVEEVKALCEQGFRCVQVTWVPFKILMFIYIYAGKTPVLCDWHISFEVKQIL